MQAYNSSGINPPRYSYLISLNERIWYKIDNINQTHSNEMSWSTPEEFLIHKDELEGWIDEYSIVSWNNKFCEKFKKATKEDVKKEFINPQYLKIKPFNWEKQIELEKKDRNKNNWLTFNMNLLGNSLLKKKLGAFFTPDIYVEEATKMLRKAITHVPKGNDYIILDRCAGTGNLQKFLTQEELSHCVLNTYDYTEWATLKGIYGERVRMLIPPTNEYRNEEGLLTNGDALSESFINYKPLNDLINNPKMTIIMLENPPFSEPTGETTRSKTSFKINDIFVKKMMKEDKNNNNIKYGSQAYSNDIANLFIWSAFKYYLKKANDSYILFSPIKYWKTQHIVDKIVLDAFLCNRKFFNTTSSSGVSLIHWQNINDSNDSINFRTLENKLIKVRKIYRNINKIFDKSKEVKDDNYDLIIISSQGTPDFKNGNLINYKINKHVTFRKYKIEEAYNYLPLWVVNNYKAKDYTEKEIIIKSSDGYDEYMKDKEFLKSCFIWSSLTHKNQCISDLEKNLVNPFGLNQESKADKIYKKLLLSKNSLIDNDDRKIIELWKEILSQAKKKPEYNPNLIYGLMQIDKEINLIIPTGNFTKDNKPIYKHKYNDLDILISELKKNLNEYYDKKIKNKLFKYQLIK
ncbi:hypothetical protein ACW95P_04360 [Candidatus Mycoplasma pogonae]